MLAISYNAILIYNNGQWIALIAHSLVKYVSLAICVQLKPSFSVICFTLSTFSKLAETNCTSGYLSFHVDRIGISLRHGPQPEYHTFTTVTRPLSASLVHVLPSISFSEKSSGRALPTINFSTSVELISFSSWQSSELLPQVAHH